MQPKLGQFTQLPRQQSFDVSGINRLTIITMLMTPKLVFTVLLLKPINRGENVFFSHWLRNW